MFPANGEAGETDWCSTDQAREMKRCFCSICFKHSRPVISLDVTGSPFKRKKSAESALQEKNKKVCDGEAFLSPYWVVNKKNYKQHQQHHGESCHKTLTAPWLCQDIGRKKKVSYCWMGTKNNIHFRDVSKVLLFWNLALFWEVLFPKRNWQILHCSTVRMFQHKLGKHC